ncbi:ABC transporter substrate-binding protein [Bacteroidota bacterium]
MKYKQTSLILFIAIIFFGLFFSCSRKFEKVDKSKVFRYNEAANISSLDPAFARDQATIWGTHQLFNGLLQLNDQLDLLPCIAHTWEVSDDGLTYRFFLRKGVKSHDDPSFPEGKGRQVTASDFVYSFNRIKDPAMASAGAWVFNYTTNDQPFIALNDTTLEIRLADPFPPFPGLLTMPYCSVIPIEAINYYGNDFREHPVGTGPFQLGYWKEGVKLVLTRNPDYFEWENGNQLPYLDAVSITFLADKQAAFLQFVQGKLDFMSGIDPNYKDELLTRDGQLNPKYNNRFRMISQPYLNTEYLGILVDTSLEIAKRSPMHNALIRKAVNYAFDREKMIQYLRNNIGTPGIYGIIPPGMPGFDSSRVYFDYQPELARELIREAGYSSSAEMPSITLVSTPDYLDICKYIQHQVSEIGIELEIEVSPPAAMREMKAMAKLPFFRASWIADYPDAENYLSLFYTPNFSPRGPNYTHYSNEEFDNLFEAAMTIQEASSRFATYRRMEEVMMNDAPVVVLYYDQVLRFVWNDVHGLGGNPMNLLTLKRVYKDKPTADVSE